MSKNDIEEDAATGTSITNNSVSFPPTAKFKPQDVTDKRHRKDRPPVILKRFKKYFGERDDTK